MLNGYLFKVITPEGTAFEADNVSFTKMPGLEGEIGIMPGHSASLIQITDGEWMVRTEDGEEWGFIKSGVVHILPNEVLVLSPFIDKKADIDNARAKSSLARAKKFLLSRDESVDRERARLALRRSETRLAIVDKA